MFKTRVVTVIERHTRTNSLSERNLESKEWIFTLSLKIQGKKEIIVLRDTTQRRDSPGTICLSRVIRKRTRYRDQRYIFDYRRFTNLQKTPFFTIYLFTVGLWYLPLVFSYCSDGHHYTFV